MSSQFANFVELLNYRVQQQPEKTVFTFIQDEETELGSLTYKELEQHAQKIAAKLQSLNAQGERALLLYQPSLEYIAAFCGCLYAGVIAVPAYPPRANKSIDRLEAIVNDAQATIALTSANIKTNIENRLQINCIATDELPLNLSQNWQEIALTPETLAFLQYTSGSTGNPKGVMVSHRNLLHNSYLINQCFQDTAESRGVSWLPPYHDMGLIGGILQPIYLGAAMVLMSPVTFLQRPYRWLKAITKYQATTAGGPNFAYDLCINQITEEQKASLDLSSWKLAFSGAEPVRNETLEKFAATFADFGFKKEAFYPCYGMAETTLIISGGKKNAPPVVKTITTEGLNNNLVVTDTSENTTTLVGCGETIANQIIAIVNSETGQECAENEIGEIWVSGESVTEGYWQKPELTQYTYHNYLQERGPFLRTGDLGFLADGELFVTGRLKDLIIIRGRNYYPQDIESSVEKSHPALKESSSAAFTVEVDGEEKLVIVAEVQRTWLRKLNPEAVMSKIRQEISLQHELQTYSILLLKTGSIPKTSSGKIRRHACRQGFLAGTLNTIGDWKQSIININEQLTVNYQTNVIEQWLVNNISQRLGVSPQFLDVNEPFASYGLDSVQAIRLTAELEDFLNIKVSPTLAYDYPTIASLSQYLLGRTKNKNSDNQYESRFLSTLPSDDIAIIGINSRLPDASCWQEAWKLLASGKDTTSPVPPERWQGEQWGAFLGDIDKFDAKFFNISPREATYMDPQQRLLLEVCWSALEDAAIAPNTLKRSKTGVFVGISSSDYAQLQVKYGTPVNAYSGTGNAHSVAANRLSYILDLCGPSLAVDTACSSSLVAVHLACNSLKQGESNLAIVAGVNLILSPELTETFTEAGMMASDGKCKTFDVSADGYVRGEGCGVVILKRLSDAITDGDRLYAVIKGSAINQDGRSNGLTAPNGLAQEDVIRQALNNAKITPLQVNYIETHGTGTPLGDPIEVNSLKRVFSERENPCYLGSVKTNIGHLEAAAGIVGLIKVVLSLQNEQIPPHLNFTKLNPLIDLGNILSIPTEITPWPKTDTPRIAGVSSFGFGGTNAHVIVADPPQMTPRGRGDQGREDQGRGDQGRGDQGRGDQGRGDHAPTYFVLTLSAKNGSALEQIVKNYVDYLTNNPQLCIRDVCLTSNLGRSHFNHRIAVVAKNTQELIKYLSSYLQGEKNTKVLQGKSLSPDKLAFLFTGQGSQYLKMGINLYLECEVFKKALDECATILAPDLDRPLLEVINENEGLLNETVYTQPAIFAIEYALGKMWQHWGIKPGAVMGHSVGEYVAAVFAGIFNLADGLKLIATRGRLMQKLAERGEMLAVFAGENEVKRVISGLEETVSIAAINGDRNIVVSGDNLGIKIVIERLEVEGIKSKKLQVSHAFHSPLMLGMVEDFRKVAEEIKYNLPTVEIVSNLTGEVMGEEIANSEYWVNHILKPVQFAKGISTLYKKGYVNFVEVGAKPTLLGMARQNNSSEKGLYLPSLRPPKGEIKQILNSLGSLYVNGYNIDWENFAQGITYQKISLPTYPFQRERYWIDESHPNMRIVNRKSPLNFHWLYQVEWIKQERVNQISSESRGNWLIFADEGGFGEKIAQQLQQNGTHCHLIYQNNPSLESENYFTSEITGIIHLWSLNIKGEKLTELKSPFISLLSVLQKNPTAKLWIITKNAITPTPLVKGGLRGDDPNLLQSTMWGLAKVIGLEYPENWTTIIDIDDSVTPELLIKEIKNADRENQIILRENNRFVPRLIPAKISQTEKITLKPDSTYLITGGLGELGLKLTSFLVEKGAKNLVLLGRSQPTENTKNFLNQLTTQGVTVTTKQVDISNFSQLETVFTDIKTTLPPLKGVFHLAGILHDGLLQNQSWDNFSQVMSPKVEGTWNLHNLTKGLDLDLFVMFSSVASLVGSPGQGNYASGNAFLDSMSYYRHSLGLPSLSINWGPLNTGMATKSQLSVRGLHKIEVNQGFELLFDLISANIPQIAVMSVDWNLLKQQFPVISPYFSVILPEEKKTDKKTEEIFSLLLENSPQEREEFLTGYLQKTLAEILQLDQERLSVTDSLLDLGMDSLMVMEAINLVKSDLKLMIYPREFYERPKIIQLAKYLASEFSKTHTVSETITEKQENLEVIFKQNIAKNTEITQKIDQPIAFILSSPRSGSTLLRVMLAGHPALFAPPELHLLPFENMKDREEELSSSYLGEGLKKAFMELKNLTPEESEKLVQKLVEEKNTIPEIYTMLQNLAGEKLLIDKSPTYSSQKANLEKSAKLFSNAKYIHLIRHPYSVIESFARLRMDKLLTTKDVNPYLLAESIWSESNQNVLDLADKIDPNNYLAVRYEDLVTNPNQTMVKICNFLGVDFDEAVLQPYEGDRLTSGLYHQSLSVGDPNFLNHQKIDAKLAENWQNITLPVKLGEKTRQIAQKFSYLLPRSASMQRDEVNMEETYLDVRGLQLCLCTWGPVNGPVILCLHGILEQGAAWLDVAVRLAQKGYRVVAPDLRGHGKSDHVGKGGSYNLLDFLGDIDAIASNLTNKPFTLVGHSLGSVVAAMFASVRPQKIAKLVLVETILPTESNNEETAENLANHLDYLASPPKHQIFPDVETAAERLLLATPALSAKKALKLAQRILEPCQGGFRWRWASILLTRAGIGFNGISKSKYLGLLKCLTVPITLIYGNRSNFNRPEDLSEQEKAMPNAHKIVISGGHNLHLESGEKLAEIISNC